MDDPIYDLQEQIEQHIIKYGNDFAERRAGKDVCPDAAAEAKAILLLFAEYLSMKERE